MKHLDKKLQLQSSLLKGHVTSNQDNIAWRATQCEKNWQTIKTIKQTKSKLGVVGQEN